MYTINLFKNLNKFRCQQNFLKVNTQRYMDKGLTTIGSSITDCFPCKKDKVKGKSA